MNAWENAILKAYALNRTIYDNVGNFIQLTKAHLRPSVHGGRPAYFHQVRSHITNLVQSGDLTQVDKGKYCLTAKGKIRIKR
jgi:hypothetical protein